MHAYIPTLSGLGLCNEALRRRTGIENVSQNIYGDLPMTAELTDDHMHDQSNVCYK